jgi:poly-beta-1,6-N-acetyl-D-glucosamine synthase
MSLKILSHSSFKIMQQIILIVFWISLAIVFYTYIGYGIMISLLARTKLFVKSNQGTVSYLPDTTLLIAAYNEAAIIEEKIKNTLALHYPKDRMKIYIVTDGSDDGTPEIVERYSEVKLFHQPLRLGKVNAVNRVMKEVNTPIVVFTDANTFINPDGLQVMVRHFADPRVGGVAGEKRIVKNGKDGASGSGEGLYWRYESYLKQKDSEVHSVQGAAGEFFSLRTSLYESPASNVIIEDFYISMRIVAKGYRFIYEPEAHATETASISIAEEWKRKVRISAGGLQAILKLRGLLNPFRYGITTFQYISHRVLRWTFAPLSLPVAFICNGLLVILSNNSIYYALFSGQILLYGLAVCGYFLRGKRIALQGFFVPFYFAMMNLAVYAGIIRSLRGRQTVLWEKAKRA